jgi:hypothetical protein
VTVLEELHRALPLFRLLSSPERPQVPAAAGSGIPFSRIESIFTRRQFTDHDQFLFTALPKRRERRTGSISKQMTDIVLLATDWQPRALIRAQLIEDGFDVVATDTWPTARRCLRPGSKPRLVVADLKGLSNPSDVLNGLGVLMGPAHVLVLTGIGTLPRAEVEALGFHTLSRPIAIRQIVDSAARLTRAS